MEVPEGKTLYAGRKVFKSGDTIPPYLEKNVKKLFEKPDVKQENKKSDFKKENK